MAKKIRLDFSKVEERSGWNTKHITEGLHKMEIAGYEETEAQDGTAMLVYALVPTDPKLRTRRFPFYCKLQQNQLWKLRDLLVAAGVSVPKKAQSIDPSVVVGKLIAAEVEDDSYQGNIRSQVQGTYGLDILDEGGEDATDAEDEEFEEDEEEFEEAEEEADEDEDEGDEDEEEDDEDDLDEDDLDDEDLDDEELYDDEDEEEDEEPEPAPKKRAAPAKKAPAKAAVKKAPAKAAPAKRVVKRR